jgi:hypothetical protein
MGQGDAVGVCGGTHLARVDLLAGEGVVVGTHVGGVGVDCGLVVERNGWSQEFRTAMRRGGGTHY